MGMFRFSIDGIGTKTLGASPRRGARCVARTTRSRCDWTPPPTRPRRASPSVRSIATAPWSSGPRAATSSTCVSATSSARRSGGVRTGDSTTWSRSTLSSTTTTPTSGAGPSGSGKESDRDPGRIRVGRDERDHSGSPLGSTEPPPVSGPHGCPGPFATARPDDGPPQGVQPPHRDEAAWHRPASRQGTTRTDLPAGPSSTFHPRRLSDAGPHAPTRVPPGGGVFVP